MLLFAVRWFIRIINLIKKDLRKASQNTKKNLNPIISQDRI